MSLTCRCRNHNISILDGYFVEELAHYFRSCCVHILCAFTELITLKDLVQTEILSYAENVFERFLSPFIPQSIKRQFKCLQNRELRAPVTDTLDSVTVRYTFSSRLPQTELRDTEFGEAFLSPLHRLANRWYNRMMGDEIFLQNFLTAYRLARTKYFDLYFENAIIHGNVEQVLILGAGFDTRAFRYEALRAKYNSTRHDNRKTFDDDMEEKTEELQPIENEPHHQDCPKFTCPKSCSTHNSRSHINVIELDALDIQKRKSKILSDYFPHSEALKFSQGVVFVGCDFSQSFCLTTALNNHFFDPKRNTLILAEDLISKLSLEVVEGMFRSLRELWMKSSSAENDRLTSNSSTQGKGEYQLSY